MALLTRSLTLVLATILLCSPATVAQPSQRHWLIGWWEGELQAAGLANPGRVLVVTSAARDGNARRTFSISGQPFYPAQIAVDGSRVRVVTAAKSVGELTRQDDDQLLGTLTFKDAKTGTSLKLSRVKTFDDHPLVGEWWGTWERPG